MIAIDPSFSSPCPRCGRTCACSLTEVVLLRAEPPGKPSLLDGFGRGPWSGAHSGRLPVPVELCAQEQLLPPADPSRAYPVQRPWEGSLRAWT